MVHIFDGTDKNSFLNNKIIVCVKMFKQAKVYIVYLSLDRVSD